MIEEGQKAPEFSLPDQDGNLRSLSDYRGSWVVVYFYPKDMTPGCTQEACDFRDNLARLQAAGASVLGISADPSRRHKKFANKESLNFPLLADEGHGVCESYGVWQRKQFMGRTFMGVVRSTFLIDGEGLVRKVYTAVSVRGHVDEVLADLREFTK